LVEGTTRTSQVQRRDQISGTQSIDYIVAHFLDPSVRETPK